MLLNGSNLLSAQKYSRSIEVQIKSMLIHETSALRVVCGRIGVKLFQISDCLAEELKLELIINLDALIDPIHVQLYL
jgi:hypothetical protein